MCNDRFENFNSERDIALADGASRRANYMSDAASASSPNREEARIV